MTSRRPHVLLYALAGALVAAVLGLLTFGAQATARPDHVPLAVAAPQGSPLRAAADRVAGQGGDAVAWQVTDQANARRLLADKDVYGVLELAPSADGVAATVVTSGAVNPGGTQVAQQVLTGAAQGLAGALGQAGITVEPVHQLVLAPASIAGRTAPLAASALLWIGGLAAGLLFVLTARGPIRARSRLLLAAGVSVFTVGVVIGFLAWWDAALPLTANVIGFLALTAVAFAAVQGALLRLVGRRAAALLGPLYLIAPAVAGQVPELLDPVYRATLWSWTPFRFSTEGLRSLLQGATSAPDVALGVTVLGALAVIGLVVIAWPTRPTPTPSAAPELAVPVSV